LRHGRAGACERLADVRPDGIVVRKGREQCVEFIVAHAGQDRDNPLVFGGLGSRGQQRCAFRQRTRGREAVAHGQLRARPDIQHLLLCIRRQ
jgi:hypothetical protein